MVKYKYWESTNRKHFEFLKNLNPVKVFGKKMGTKILLNFFPEVAPSLKSEGEEKVVIILK